MIDVRQAQLFWTGPKPSNAARWRPHAKSVCPTAATSALREAGRSCGTLSARCGRRCAPAAGLFTQRLRRGGDDGRRPGGHARRARASVDERAAWAEPNGRQLRSIPPSQQRRGHGASHDDGRCVSGWRQRIWDTRAEWATDDETATGQRQLRRLRAGGVSRRSLCPRRREIIYRRGQRAVSKWRNNGSLTSREYLLANEPLFCVHTKKEHQRRQAAPADQNLNPPWVTPVWLALFQRSVGGKPDATVTGRWCFCRIDRGRLAAAELV